jgi:hypothetical protein
MYESSRDRASRNDMPSSGAKCLLMFWMCRRFPDALGVYIEMVKSRQGDVSDMTLAVLHDIRIATAN